MDLRVHRVQAGVAGRLAHRGHQVRPVIQVLVANPDLVGLQGVAGRLERHTEPAVLLEQVGSQAVLAVADRADRRGVPGLQG